MTDRYTLACISAATNQGFGPVAIALNEVKQPFVIDQTGGFTMVLRFALADGRFVTMICEGDDEKPYMVYVYKNRQALKDQYEDQAPVPGDEPDELDLDLVGLLDLIESSRR